ncbi:MAG TPA: hypothetical protein VMW21_01235 [Patescibacteria group bacterium]|nr:hypothetical protein [Patescibacteria group bacterium]
MTSVFLFLPTLLIALIIGIIVLISGLFCQISGAVLDWIISPGFMSLSYTTNEIVAMGLDITKDFVNLLLVIFLVFIALSIALKVGDYAGKKVFAKLILIALLVNFAPVFVGLIVDAANIVMNFFLEGIGESVSEIGTGVTSFGQGVIKILFSFSGNLSERAGLLMQAVTQIVVNLAMGLAFFLFAAIFLIRYVVIWVLTILSPLAFVFWILPATKKFWDMWWQQLIQWSIVGIPIAFFLYLAMNSFSVLQQTFVGKLNMPGIEATTVGWLDQVFPFFVIIVFLFLGFTVGLQTGAMGASAAIGLAKGAGLTGGKWLGKKTWRGAKTSIEEKTRFREAAGKAVRVAEKVPFGRWFIPEPARKYAEFRPAIETAKKDAGNYSSQEIAYRMATGADYGVKAVGGMMELASRGDFQDFFNAYKKKYKVKNDADLFKIPEFKDKTGRLLQIALSGGAHSTLLRGDPRLARAAAGIIPGYENLDEKGAVSKAVGEARGQHIANWEKEVLDDKLVVEAGMERGRDFWESVNKSVKKGQETALQTIDKILKDFVKERPDLEGKPMDVWQAYKKDFKEKHQGKEGFFSYLESDRAKEQGWTTDLMTPKIFTSKYTSSPGEALGMEPPGTGTKPPRQPGAGSSGKGPDISAPWGVEDAEYEDIPSKKTPPKGRPGVGGTSPTGKPPRPPKGRPGVGGS